MKKIKHEGSNPHITLNTSISVATDNGAVIYRGYDLQELAEHSHFEETAYLLLFGRLPGRDELTVFSKELGENRGLPDEIMEVIKSRSHHGNFLHIIQTAVSLFGSLDPDANAASPEPVEKTMMRTIARIPTLIAAYYRIVQNKPPIPPMQRLTHAQNFLYLLSGYAPDADAVKALDAILILYAEDCYDMSSIVARLSAATCGQYNSALTDAISSFQGKHRQDTADNIMRRLLNSEPENAAVCMEEILSGGRHAQVIHEQQKKSGCSRARIARAVSRSLSESTNDTLWHQTCRNIEGILNKRAIPCPPDLYIAPVLHMLGVPVELFVPIFLIGRIAGWSAHILEQLKNKECVQPCFAYHGPRHLSYTPRSTKQRTKAA